MENNELKFETVEDLKRSFLKIYASNGYNALWAVDTLEYLFYEKISLAKERKEQEEFIKALRLLHGEKQTKF